MLNLQRFVEDQQLLLHVGGAFGERWLRVLLAWPNADVSLHPVMAFCPMVPFYNRRLGRWGAYRIFRRSDLP